MTTINFLADVPRLGSSISVKEPLNEVQRKLITANRYQHATVEFTKPDGDSVVIPIRLVGPVEGKKVEREQQEEQS